MTCAPAAVASWVTKVPTPPAAPTINTDLETSGSSDSTMFSALPPAVGSAAAIVGVQAGRPSSQQNVLVDRDVFSICANRPERRDQEPAEQLVPGREASRRLHGGFYDTGQIGAKDEGERGGHP